MVAFFPKIKLMRIVLATLSLCAIAAAQPIVGGMKIGTSLGSSIVKPAGILPANHNLTFGPYVELRLPAHLALEADFLYEQSLYDALTTGGSRVQIPVIAKYRFGGSMIRPFVGAGAVFTRINGLSALKDLNHSSNVGGTIAVGVELKALFLRLTPEFRYNATALRDIENPLGLYKSKRGTAYFLMNFGF